MKTLITDAVVRRLEPVSQDIWDARCRGLVLRCRTSGRHSYIYQARRGRWITIGAVDAFRPDEARKKADELRVDIANGRDPAVERRLAAASSLERFLEEDYGPWVTVNRKTGAETLARIKATFAEFLAVPIVELGTARMERWRTGRLQAGVTAATVNRDIASLRSVLSRALDWGSLTTHPLAKFKAVKVDHLAIVRYLSPQEEKRLRAALAARDHSRRKARASANRWRRVRDYPTLTPFGRYTDHVTPLVLLALNTGLRRGELLALRWADVDLTGASLAVRGADAKTGETRHVPLNSDIVTVLKAWRGTDERGGYVFAMSNGKAIDGTKTSWLGVAKAAGLTDFRFHDLRHSFASKLVQRGVDLNTVRELLGHADLKMTLRYAHLAPAVKAAAVERLVAR